MQRFQKRAPRRAADRRPSPLSIALTVGLTAICLVPVIALGGATAAMDTLRDTMRAANENDATFAQYGIATLTVTLVRQDPDGGCLLQIEGTGLLPGSTVTDEGTSGSGIPFSGPMGGTVAENGTYISAAGLDAGGRFKAFATTAAGDPIESNELTCPQPAP